VPAAEGKKLRFGKKPSAVGDVKKKTQTWGLEGEEIALGTQGVPPTKFWTKHVVRKTDSRPGGPGGGGY